jgi:hypothetical protein
MPHSDLFKSLRDGSAPKNLRLLASRGLVPLPPAEMLVLLVRMIHGDDSAIAANAEKTLADWTEDELLAQVQARDCDPPVLQFLAAITKSQPLLEAVILNPSTPSAAIEKLATTVSTELLELILYNRVRLLAAPIILDNILKNPSATPQIHRFVLEINAEFFGVKKKEYSIEAPAEAEAAEVQTSLSEIEIHPEDLSLESLPSDPEARDGVLTHKLAQMPLPQKIRLAVLGGREIRAILVRDPNRQVARSVLHSPKLTENEIEGIASMRNVSEDILRDVGNNKEWTRRYAVALNLVKNPKTPLIISQQMLYRLHSKDLKVISRDRSIPESVRRNALQTLAHRNSARSNL